ncbi:site-specific integrase [Rhodoferax sp. BLA1]|uniref:site-specific integrase n=1 Tax=Rhodoferax sp. BLA1 TaxID=2576062 RepID=UPI001C556142|nr:site-specific integrase [Rhodoferax sp. BLA1]
MIERSGSDANQQSEGETIHPVANQGYKRYQSRAGYWFDECEPIWKLDKNNDVYISKIFEFLPAEAKNGFISTLVYYAVTLSAAHTRNIFESFLVMLRDTKPKKIDTIALLNWRAKLSRQTEWKLATVRGFLYKWHDLGYSGVGEDVIDLLESWTLRGNIKGDAVKRLDPTEGPLTDNELLAFNEGVIRAFEQAKIELSELAICLLLSHTGRRPKQLTHTKICDLDGTKVNKKGEPMFLIHIPRAKQRGEVFRDSFKTFAMTLELWTVLSAQRKYAISSVERLLGYELQEADRVALPLFPDLAAFDGIESVNSLRSLLATDNLHLQSDDVTATVKMVVKAAGITSERTGELIELVATRFRYTKGTRAAREGFGQMVIAELLDHTDTQNVDVYTQNVPEHARALNKAMALQLAPYAQAFQGVLVDRESDAKRGDDLASRIKFKGKNTATCGQYGFCGANVPIPCYTCQHFQPWLEGPHEEVLADLLAEREQVEHITGDVVVAAVNDRTIFAVVDVIQRCHIRRAELAKMAKKAGK